MIGRILFLAGCILLVVVFLLDIFIFHSFATVSTKIMAFIATAMIIWFVDSGMTKRGV